MQKLEFDALGTHWVILVDAPKVSKAVIKEIQSRTDEFDQQYSRFIETSEASKFRRAKAGEYQLSTPLATMLQAAQNLRELTDGGFDASIATLLEKVGYDQHYNFEQAPDNQQVEWELPQWSIKGTLLTIDGPVVFDVGGIGKGYWIDAVSKVLQAADLPHHLVDGGGDMMATTKADGTGWQVALEWPGKPDTALGVVKLKHQGLAVSDVFRRRWKNWHHLIHARTRQPITEILGCAAVAPSAFLADQLSSALSFGQRENYPKFAQHFSGQYVILWKNQELLVSSNWTGELF